MTMCVVMLIVYLSAYICIFLSVSAWLANKCVHIIGYAHVNWQAWIGTLWLYKISNEIVRYNNVIGRPSIRLSVCRLSVVCL